MQVRLHREGLRDVLAGRAGLDVIGTAADPREALAALPALDPDVVLVDLRPDEGVAAVRALVRSRAGLRVVALLLNPSPEAVVPWAEAGITGYVTSHQSIDDLVTVVRHAAVGEMVCPPPVSGALARRLAALAGDGAATGARLTRREREILCLINAGLTNKQIAERLHIELPTVKNHVHNILDKLGAHGRAEAASWARRHGLPGLEAAADPARSTHETTTR